MWTQQRVTTIANHRGRLACIVLCLLATSTGDAQQPAAVTRTAIRLQTAHLTFFPGSTGERSVLVKVTEVGPPGVLSDVGIVVYDQADRIVAKATRALTRFQPVMFHVPLDVVERHVEWRFDITIAGVPDRGSLPIVVLEDVDAGSFTIGQRISCAPPAWGEGQVTPDCPGVVVTNFVVGG